MSKRFDEPLLQLNSLISKSEFSQQFYFLYAIVILFYLIIDVIIVIVIIFLFIYLSILVILYSQVLYAILASGDRVILFVCFFVYILHEVKCKYILIYKKIKLKKNSPTFVITF